MSAPTSSEGTITLPTEHTIIVVRTEVEKTGNRGGRPWTLYRVFATEVDGTPINDVLKTFDSLSGTVTVTTDAYVKDGVIQNYTLKKKRAPGTRSRTSDTRPIGHLDLDRIDQLESRVAVLESKLGALIRSIDTPLETS